MSGFVSWVWIVTQTMAAGAAIKSIAPTNSIPPSILASASPNAPQAYCWLRQGGGAGADSSYGIAVDPVGNCVVSGIFEGTATFGETNLVSRGLSDVFIAKYDRFGTLLWVQQAGGARADTSLGLALDSQANSYVTGYFTGTARFGEIDLTTTGTYDWFVAKYDPEGKLLWAKTSGRSDAAFGTAIAVDSDGNAYITGGFALNAFFGSEEFLNGRNTDAFFAKFDRAGVLQWAKRAGGDGEDQGTGIGVDSQGLCYATGFFEERADFGTETLASFGNQDAFLCQFNARGEQQWVQQAGGNGKTQSAGLTVNQDGQCWVAGYFETTAYFDTNELSSEGFFDFFLAKYQPDGKVAWARNTGQSLSINAASVGTDGFGNSYVTGSFMGDATFEGVTLTNNTVSKAFVAKYNPEGDFVWAKKLGSGATPCAAFGIAPNVGGTCYIVGETTGKLDFDGTTLDAGEKSDVFLAKLLGDSGAATLSLQIGMPRPGQFEVQFLGDSCGTFRLEASTDLDHWTDVLDAKEPSGPVTWTETTEPSGTPRFYRVSSP